MIDDSIEIAKLEALPGLQSVPGGRWLLSMAEAVPLPCSPASGNQQPLFPVQRGPRGGLCRPWGALQGRPPGTGRPLRLRLPSRLCVSRTSLHWGVTRGPVLLGHFALALGLCSVPPVSWGCLRGLLPALRSAVKPGFPGAGFGGCVLLSLFLIQGSQRFVFMKKEFFFFCW